MYFCIFIATGYIMSKETAMKIYEWASYILLLAATVVFFISGKNVDLTLIVLVCAVYMRVLMYRTKYRICEEENEEVKRDLRKLTALLKEKEQQQAGK